MWYNALSGKFPTVVFSFFNDTNIIKLYASSW